MLHKMTDGSPIVQYVPASGCYHGHRCFLYWQTDLLETMGKPRCLSLPFLLDHATTSWLLIFNPAAQVHDYYRSCLIDQEIVGLLGNRALRMEVMHDEFDIYSEGLYPQGLLWCNARLRARLWSRWQLRSRCNKRSQIIHWHWNLV